MTKKNRPEVIEDKDLDIAGGEGGPGAIDAFRTNDLKSGQDSIALDRFSV